MKVLHINSNYIYTWLHQKMIEKLEAQGIESTVFSPVGIGSKARIDVKKDVIVAECFKNLDKISFYYKQSKIFNALKSHINAEDFDLVHAYTLFTDGNIAYGLNKEHGIPYTVAVRNTDVNAFFRYRPYLKGRGINILKNASAIFFLSKSYQKNVFEKYIPEGLREQLEKKTYIIPNGIDDFWHSGTQSKALEDPKKLDLVFAGRIEKNKNVETTAKACRVLIDKGYDVSLTAVGTVFDKDIFEALSKETFITFLSQKSKEELAEIYTQKSIFVMPSFQESFGLVYAEAMSKGLPVIYTRGQGFDGQFEEGEVGYSVDPKDPAEIAEKIIAVTNDYNRLSKNCSENSKLFDWSRITGIYKQIYSDILNIKDNGDVEN